MREKLPKQIVKTSKRVGRGYGSGRGGHTVGRGAKGQKARGKVGILFEGVKMKKSFIKRLPLRRGKGKFKAKGKPIIVKLGYLNLLPAGTKVNLDTLVESGIVNETDAKKFGVKILGNGDLKKKLIIELPISNSAQAKIDKIGKRIAKDSLKKSKKGSSVKTRKNKKSK